ncbi:MAG: SGNH/GDSL hydrolase family protein [Verrucomicrobiales bacterium]|jgi:lysophospholipase L1-like esterase|nr:SGNH/GDSL hydrolase family protein [Verrucomicrobiales bacterium]MBP9224925.1 SGNH/GDSL hydrolase family protein [Verrucomicrobiales bacterium]
MKFSFCLFLPALTACLSLAGAAEPSSGSIEMGTRGVSNFIAKMEKEGKAHVAFLGGSITQNTSGHTKMVPEWLKAHWPNVEFTFTRAGLGSTCSTTGAFRLDRDVLSKGPVDLLIVEFAVNDDQDAMHDAITAKRGLEGIIRQYFKVNPTGDVISVQFVNPAILAKLQAGEEAVSVAAHREVARHYGLPIVDVGRALAAEIAAGRMTWETDYKDTHPNQIGYQFASDLITKVIEDTVSGETPQTVVLPELLDPDSYSEAMMVDPQELSWLGGWKFAPVSKELLPVGSIRGDYTPYSALRSDADGNYLYHTFSGSMLGAFVLAGPDAGILEVSIDGGDWKKVDLFHRYSKGLNYPRSVVLADGLGHSLHTAAIRVSEEKNPESQGNTATILYFEVNR